MTLKLRSAAAAAADPQPQPGPEPLPETMIAPRGGWRVVDWRELLAYRDLFRFLVQRDVRVLYKQSVLGIAWALIGPVISMLVFTVVFGRLAKVPSDGVPYSIFAYTALVPWTYFSTAMTASTNSLVSNSGLLTKVYFPRLLIPLTPVCAKLVDFTIAIGLLAILMGFYRIAPSSAALLLPLLVVVMILSAAGIGMWTSALAIQYRDVKFALPLAAQLLMYAAPVVWPASLVPAAYRPLYGLYPMVGVIEGFRAALLGTQPMPWDLVLPGIASAIVLFVTGALYFRRLERVFADVA